MATLALSLPYVEQDCTIEHAGRKFTAGGSFASESHIIAYLGDGGQLTNWRGDAIGRYRITSTWKTPRSWMSSTMHQVYAVVNGIAYTGRSAGSGMIFKGKRTKR